MTSGILGMDVSTAFIDAAYRLKCSSHELEMYSWPETFSSTSGPRNGLGGQAFTTFQVYAFRREGNVKGIKRCAGISKEWHGDMCEEWEK